jgi:hypothetical protein
VTAVSRLVILGFAGLSAAACCDENVKVIVLAGHQEMRACVEAVRDGKSSPLAVVCGGSEVTICWGSNVQDVSIDPVGNSHGNPVGENFAGVEYFTPTASAKITVKASDCASASQDVTVISGDTPVTFDAGWKDKSCGQIDYVFDPLFVDPHARSISITALWAPFTRDQLGNMTLCKTPPFLAGFKTPDLFGFKIDDPLVTKAFSQPIALAGDWQFSPQFTCPTGEFTCEPSVAFPFSTTVRCPAQ